ncbi:MAG: tubulin-like doman-containing protein [Fimbriimonas sp.]
MANRTLVVGLGTTGREICEGVLERIDGQDGGLANVPWVKLVAFDTKETDDTELGRRGMAHHIGIEAARYREYVTNPGKFDAVNGFTTWSDSSVISKADGGGSDHGAGNTRMIGRASFMHPDVIAKVHSTIDSALKELHGLDTTIRRPGQEPVDIGAQTVVFVCGALVGGTGSGTLIDLGYLLRNHPAHGAKVKVVGILGVPDLGLSVNFQKGNAYAAITELGYFYYPGAKYQAKFALPAIFPADVNPGPGAKPFDGIFLTQPRAGKTKSEVAVMNSGLSEFVYLAATSETLPQIAAELINPGTVYANTPDRLGRPQNFASIGVSVIEYPVEHIVRGGTARLTSSTLRHWLDRGGFDTGWAEGEFLNKVGLSNGSIVDAILAPPINAPAFQSLIADTLQSGVHDAQRSGDSALSQAESQIEAGFNISAAAGPRIPAGEIAARVKSKAQTVKDERLAAFTILLRDYISNYERGPNWAEGLLTHVEKRCREEVEALSATVDPAALQEYADAMSSMRAEVAEISRSFLGTLGWKSMALDVTLDKYRHAAEVYYDLRLRQLTFKSVEDLYGSIIAFCQKLKFRLTDPDRGIRQWAEKMHGELRAEYEAKRDYAPVVNGLALYVAGPNQTLDSDFVASMQAVSHDGDPSVAPGFQKEEFAMAKLLRQWTWIQEQLVTEYSTFDPATVLVDGSKVRVPRAEEADAIRKLVRHHFNQLYGKSAAAMLVSQTNWQALLSNAATDADPFIKVDDSYASDGTPASVSDLRTPTFAFYAGATNAQGQTPEALIHQQLSNSFLNFVNIAQPHKIVLVKARSTFAAGSIIGINEMKAFWEQTGGEKERQSRRDIRWRNLDGQPLIPNLMLNIGRVLAGLALDLIQAAGHGPILVEVPPSGPGGVTKTISLNRDIEEAACQVEKDYGVAGWLHAKVNERITSLGLRETAERFNRFAQTVQVLGLTHLGKPLDDGSRVYGLMSEFLRSVPGLESEWIALSRPAEGTRNYIRKEYDEADQGIRAGFYCPGCNCYLGKLSEEEQVNALAICPNPVCRYPMR